MIHREFPYRLLAILCFLFLFTRLYRITESLEFFADIGRDHYVLMRAIQTLKPPLLGPSTSVLPISQSPVYYFLNFPAFILTGYSPYTTVVTLILLFLGAGAWGVWILRKQPHKLTLYLMVWMLVIFHPQLVAQTRYPWNPTFAFPFLLAASAWMLSGRLRKRSIWGISLCVALAIGCTYSVLPVSAVIVVAFMRWYPNWRRQILFALTVSLIVVFAPIVVADLRSDFLISKSVLSALHESRSASPFVERVLVLMSGLTGVKEPTVVSIGGVLTPVVVSWMIARHRVNKSTRELEHFRWGILFGVSSFFTLLFPIHMQSHYLFGLLLMFFFVLASMQRGLLVFTLCLCAWYWIPSLSAQLHFIPRRTIGELEACVRSICERERGPLYLSEQSWHSYHFAPEYLFLFNKYGCFARDVIQDPGVATRMGVVVDHSSFDPATTRYAELTAFGLATVREKYECGGDIHVVMLERKL